MKFRFYIASMFDGNVSGTNDEQLAKDISGSEDDFVIDTETGKWLLADETTQDVPEKKRYVGSEDDAQSSS